MGMFPDTEVMKRIKAAFEADPRITADYKKNVRVSFAGNDYIVIANKMKFLAQAEGSGWRFQNIGLES